MNVLDKFYDYQLEAFWEVQNHDKGIVCLPTGTGKTFVQAGVIANDIVENPGFRMYVINAPRILLSYQLMREVQKYLINNNIEARYMAVHSGRMDDSVEILKLQQEKGITYSEVNSTTSTSDIREMIETAQIQDLPLIFFSTYNSAYRIQDGRVGLPKINITLNDEAHYLVQERFYDIVDTLESDRKYFFTATTKETPSDEGRGMNNEGTYGDIIYNMTPREAIERGKMVRPRMHFVTAVKNVVYNRDDMERSMGNMVVESYKQHEYTLTGTDAPKMLVASNGTQDIKNIIKSNEIARIQKGGTSIYAVASDPEIGNWVNGEKVSRPEFLSRLKKEGSDSTKRMIIIHYDILTEGIDIPGITGVLFLRSMGKSKFIQTFGRAARLDSDDRAAFENGEYTHNDLDLMDKPYAWVIVPVLTHDDEDTKENIGDLIYELRDYGFEPKEDVVVSNTVNGIGTLGGDDAVGELKRRTRHIGNYIEDVQAQLEDQRIANMTYEELMGEFSNSDNDIEIGF